MKFTDLLKRDVTEIDTTVQEDILESSTGAQGSKTQKKPEEVLRGAGFKIKLVTPTSFGTQIDFAKKYDEKEIEELLKDFTVKIKNKSVFIVD